MSYLDRGKKTGVEGVFIPKNLWYSRFQYTMKEPKIDLFTGNIERKLIPFKISAKWFRIMKTICFLANIYAVQYGFELFFYLSLIVFEA
jgi:hypothetical protein